MFGLKTNYLKYIAKHWENVCSLLLLNELIDYNGVNVVLIIECNAEEKETKVQILPLYPHIITRLTHGQTPHIAKKALR